MRHEVIKINFYFCFIFKIIKEICELRYAHEETNFSDELLLLIKSECFKMIYCQAIMYMQKL